MPNAGDIIKALDFPAAVSAAEDTSGTTTSTTYTSTLTGGVACGVTFIAPTSGRVIVHNAALLDHSSASGETYLGWILRTGSTVGSGTVVVSAADSRAILHVGTAAERHGADHLAGGLTPGATYNIIQAFRTSASTATYANKVLIVKPTT